MRNRCQNLILDFTHVYEDETVRDREQFQWIDCSDIEESHLYCSPSAYEEIRKRIEPFGISGIHFIDSGNYHYVTKIMTDFLKEPFVLVCFDHHTDMQKPMVEGMTSCGDWAGQVLGENTYLRQLVLIGPPQRDIDGIEIGKPQSQNIQTGEKDKLLTFSEEEILPIRALRIPKSLLKPLMLIRTMIDNHIQNEPDTQLLPVLNHPVKILHRAEHRIDLIVIRYIISVIHHR